MFLLQDDFAHLRPLCYPQVDVAIVCFSVTNPTSFDNVRSKWIKEVRQHCPGVPIVIVGMQIDRRDDQSVLRDLKSKGKRPVTKSDGSKLAAQCKAVTYVECSALMSYNIKGAFDEAVAAALEMNSTPACVTPRCSPGKCAIL